ncbi:membrane protein [Pseudomonas sp. StFLB209]|uniref:PepSY-associated TM helix domain-containing protein n=1 Tax=Pseudomonas sp. StFLB209 TaxID=1028989 RepID=UPI0004F587D6|nr:PepSY-associated TM helix domain-containing protein [Pseudomonas sp. StFLB209]BAP41449.1 membrane protein [Pseudomonas sp. StFLB209]
MKEGLRQAMAWLHTWLGLIFGWLLFAIFLTGTLSYFRAEITHWMTPELEVRALDSAQSVRVAQDYLQEKSPSAVRWFINLPEQRDPTMNVVAVGKPAKPGERGKFERVTLDPLTGTEIQARETRGGDFFYRFHYQLEMPYPWGRWLTTIAAMVMFIALITGIIVHKKVFKEFFTFRPGKGQRSWLDGHNALGVLVLPFHLMITYSSLLFFASLVMPASIITTYGDNTRAFYDELYPASAAPKAQGVAAPLIRLDSLLSMADERWGENMISRVTIDNPGDANARATLYRNGHDRVTRQQGDTLVFDATSGALLSDSLPAKAAPSLITEGFWDLHMGQFANIVVRWLYFVFGIAGTAMIGTGLVMWLGKRVLKHAKSGVLPFELRLVQILNISSMAGLMLAVVVVFWANRLLPVGMPGREDWEVNAFFIIWALSVLHAALRNGQTAWREQLGLGALLFGALPLLDIVTSSQYLLTSLKGGSWVLIGFDLTALATGLLLGWAALKFRNRPEAAAKVRKAPRPAAALPEPTDMTGAVIKEAN